MDHVTFNAKCVKTCGFFYSVQYCGFTEATHKALIEQSKHNTSALLDINLV